MVCDPAIDGARTLHPRPLEAEPARDGFRVRRVRPSDGPAVLEMHARCSPATRYARWLGPGSMFPKPYLRALLAGRAEHIAVVAVAEDRPGCVVGLASAAVTSDGWRELGLLVEDHYQSQGIGMLLLTSLVGLLQPDEDLCASALFENCWLLGKLARFGAMTIRHDCGVSHARVVRPRLEPR
jgi:GNAT superfamily N-acetyltransferase